MVKRIIIIIPNVVCYLMFAVFSAFVLKNAKGIYEIDRLWIWIILLGALLIVSVFSSYRIWKWIKEGKI